MIEEKALCAAMKDAWKGAGYEVFASGDTLVIRTNRLGVEMLRRNASRKVLALLVVDPDVIPLGATVYIDGRAYTAEDAGAFKGNIVDVYMNDRGEALRFGRREATITWEI